MATITVEDGSIVTGANSYITAAQLSTYATDRGITLSGTASQLLLQAMDYLESLKYQGDKRDEDQPLQWPRDWVVVDGYQIDNDTIPQLLKDGQAEVAIAIDQGTGPLRDLPRVVKREQVSSIAVEYDTGMAPEDRNRRYNAKLWKLLRNAGTGTIRI